MGCPLETPFKCSNGECINLEETSCPVNTCPKDKPYKCLDGLCVETNSFCPSMINVPKENHCLGDG